MNRSNNLAWPADEPQPHSLLPVFPWSGQYALSVLATASLLPWVWRFYSNYRSTGRDVKAVLLVCLLLHWREILGFCTVYVVEKVSLSSGLLVIGTSIGALWFTLSRKRSLPAPRNTTDVQVEHKLFLKPLILPCRTTHTRLFPTRHSFSYTYLFVGIPIGWRGPAGSILSADTKCLRTGSITPAKTWFTVEAEDYLQRGRYEDGLHGKLRDYLSSQGIDASRYPYGYLVTAPRVLGFSFNPVSFWYLYDQDSRFTAMILEVNNTFDERRMYFLDRTTDDTQSETTLKQAWQKDFHVSPFNDRAGSYTVEADDPFSSQHQIDNNIVLKSADGKPKIVARIFSTESALDATNMTTWQTLHFVLRWWWVGFMTNPRIVREARLLWVKKLQVYYRPEVMRSSIARNATTEEIELELYFRRFLQTLSNRGSVRIEYTAAGTKRASPVILEPKTPPVAAEDTDVRTIKIHVLTPAFYTELVGADTLSDVFTRHCFHPNEGQQMVHTPNVELLKALLDQIDTYLSRTPPPTIFHLVLYPLRPATLTKALIALVSNVKNPPHPVSNQTHQPSPPSFPLFIATSCTTAEIGGYNKAAFRILLADRIALGMTSLLDVYAWCVWAGLVVLAARAYTDGFDVLMKGEEVNGLSVPNLCWGWALHLWWYITGPR